MAVSTRKPTRENIVALRDEDLVRAARLRRYKPFGKYETE